MTDSTDDGFDSGAPSGAFGAASPWTDLRALSVEVTRHMPREIEAALLLVAQHANVPHDGTPYRITIDLVIRPDGHVLGAVLGATAVTP